MQNDFVVRLSLIDKVGLDLDKLLDLLAGFSSNLLKLFLCDGEDLFGKLSKVREVINKERFKHFFYFFSDFGNKRTGI